MADKLELTFGQIITINRWMEEHPNLHRKVEGYAGVTSTASVGEDKAGLHFSRGRAMAKGQLKSLQAEWDARASIGHIVHAVNESWRKGEHGEYPDFLAGYVDALRLWEETHEPEWLSCEQSYVNESPKFFGTSDGDAVINGERIRIDLKTGSLYHHARLQLAAYRYAQYQCDWDEATGICNRQPNPGVDGCALLQLNYDGTYRYLPIEAGWKEYLIFERKAWLQQEWFAKTKRSL